MLRTPDYLLHENPYQTIYDDSGNVRGFLNQDTGELENVILVPVPIGTKIITPGQQARNELYKQLCEKKEMDVLRYREKQEKTKLYRSAGGHYFFMNVEHPYKGLSPASLARLAYLGTYLSYRENELHMTQKTPMRKADLVDVLGVSVSSARRFWMEVNGEYLWENEDGTLILSPNYFHRGDQQDIKRHWDSQTIFVSAYRNLFEETPASRHRYIGYVLQTLPWLNREFNILCENPCEESFPDIAPLTLTDFCRLIGYSPNQRSRLAAVYGDMGDLLTISEDSLSVSPKVIYRGSHGDEFDIFEKLKHS